MHLAESGEVGGIVEESAITTMGHDVIHFLSETLNAELGTVDTPRMSAKVRAPQPTPRPTVETTLKARLMLTLLLLVGRAGP